MYSLLTYFITSKVLDIVENGIDQAKAAMIITDDATEVSKLIYQKLGRTVTLMEGTGLVSGKKEVLYCVISSLPFYMCHSSITPQAILSPEFPEGCEVKSSALPCTTTERPITSERVRCLAKVYIQA